MNDSDDGDQPHVLLYLEHSIQDGSQTAIGEYRTISKKVFYVAMDRDGNFVHQDYAPYLDYRPLRDDEPNPSEIITRAECSWIISGIEDKTTGFAIANVVPQHIDSVRSGRFDLLSKTENTGQRSSHEGDRLLGPPGSRITRAGATRQT